MTLSSTRVSPLERTLETMAALISFRGACTLVWCILRRGNFSTAPINLPALFCRVLPCKVEESSIANFLSNQKAVVIEAFGAFSCLEKYFQCLFGVFYDLLGVFATSCLGSSGPTLRSIYKDPSLWKENKTSSGAEDDAKSAEVWTREIGHWSE